MYSKEIQNILKRNKINIGDKILIEKNKKRYKGLLMPKIEIGDPNSIVIKIDSGYNIGINNDKRVIIKKLSKGNLLGKASAKQAFKKILSKNKGKKTISILHTGGTIASSVDYRTGGVVSKFKPEELVSMFPELGKIANIKSELVFQIFSEEMEPEHWSKLAKKISDEIKKGVDGIIITHGTDTMHYTASALSFMLQDLPVPVILVGAQRSSDRGSSDAGMNVICAANFITNSDFADVAICMHGTVNDSSCLILPANKTKKLHTSRRDAFRPINSVPWAVVDYNSEKIKFLRKDYQKRGGKLELKNKIEKKVAIVRIRPGFDSKELEFYEKAGYKGIVLEGTGLGHTPTKLLMIIERMSKKMVIVMTSQCIYGRTNMNVYSSGRDLQGAGVISGKDMLPEVAYVKLSWLLANHPKDVKKLIKENLRGEISSRTLPEEFLY